MSENKLQEKTTIPPLVRPCAYISNHKHVPNANVFIPLNLAV